MSNAVCLKELWKKILQAMSSDISRAHLLTWFADTSILEKNDNTIIVGVPTTFAYDWIAKRYIDPLLKAAIKVDASISDIRLEIRGDLKNKDNIDKVDIVKVIRKQDKQIRKLRNKPEFKLNSVLTSRMLNPKFRLKNFITGPENKLVHAACVTSAARPGSFYNPLFIYGGVGLGKTHLLQAIGNEILANTPDKVVVYTTSEKFMSEMVESIKKKKMQQFRNKYRHVDCLLIDDIQFLTKKDATQMEFFHTFNDLYELNKQIVISSDCPPSELNGFADRLKSRFEMGMVLDLTIPSEETRLEILQHKCNEHGVMVNKDILEHIASNVEESVRELEGVFSQLIAYAEIQNCQPTVQLVNQILSRLAKCSHKHNVTKFIKSTKDILKLVAEYYGLHPDDILGPKRTKQIAYARHVSMYLIRKNLQYSFEKIGSDLGGRNHATVLHSFYTIKKKIASDLNLMQDIKNLEKSMSLYK